MDSKWIILHFVLPRKNGYKSIFLNSILFSERKMGIDYILDHENPL